MKYYLLAGAVVIAAAVATMIAHSEYSLSKRFAVEPEHKRPDSYQDLLFKPQPEVQMRAPASAGDSAPADGKNK